jgi:hypothetical protein
MNGEHCCVYWVVCRCQPAGDPPASTGIEAQHRKAREKVYLASPPHLLDLARDGVSSQLSLHPQLAPLSQDRDDLPQPLLLGLEALG